ncbi:MAG: hypothetical protein IPP60_08180 [Sphingobacteriales bacterium]|nr:hypothetical protein [Sphingobacteriales bacterium]
MKTTKTIFFAIKVVLLSLLATSCIPTVPGGNPTPNNTFNVNIDNKDVKADPDNPKYTTVLVDGDIVICNLIHLPVRFYSGRPRAYKYWFSAINRTYI